MISKTIVMIFTTEWQTFYVSSSPAKSGKKWQC